MDFTKMSYKVVFMFTLIKQCHFIQIEIERNVCGFEPKCTGNQTCSERKETSCCLFCGCTDICFERNNCCVDKPESNKESLNKRQQCLPAMYKPRRTPGDVLVDSYFTRSHCPKSYSNFYIKNKCEVLVPRSFEELRLASSEDGKIVYKNKFCGLCHGENSVVSWEMKMPGNTNCKNVKFIPTDNIEQFIRYIISYCIILFKRPSELDVRSVLCFDKTKVKRQCNVTGQWDVYNSELESLCHNKSSSMVVDHAQDNTFRNPYCYLCNRKTVHASCYNSFVDRSKLQSFVTLINFDKWMSKSGMLSKPDSGFCKTDEILDTFFGRCRRLFCPRFTLPFHGKCILVIDFGQCITILIRPVHQSHVNQSEVVKNIFHSSVAQMQLQKIFGLFQCFACSINLYHKKSNETDIYIGLCLQETTDCPIEIIWAKIFEAKIDGFKYSNLKLNGKRQNVQMEIVNDQFESSQYTALQDPLVFSTTCRSNEEERQLLCSKVELTKAEFETVVRTHVNSGRLIFTSTEIEVNETTFVCCKNYIITNQSTGYQSFTKHGVVALTFVYLFLVR